jgi:hypothetical protein
MIHATTLLVIVPVTRVAMGTFKTLKVDSEASILGVILRDIGHAMI